MAISPYALLDPGSNGFDDLLGNMLRPRAPRGLRMPSGDEPMQLSPEQEQSLLGSIGQTATSGLASVGNLLDVPGSMVRDVLTLNNPFDQLLDPFGSSNRITGREMLTDWGWTAPNDPDAWEAADFAGFGAEVLTDPLSLFPPFALTKAGKLAKAGNLLGDVSKVATAKAGAKVGKLKGGMTTTLQDLLNSPDLIGGNVAARKALSDAAAGVGQNLDDLLGQPLRGSVGLAAPFMQAADAVGSGSKAGQAIAGGLDSAADWLGTSWPGRAGAALFSRGAKSTFTPEAQEAMGGITRAQDVARAESLGKGFEGVKGLDQLLKAGVPEADLEHMLDVFVEQKPGATLGAQGQRAAATLAGMSPAHQTIAQNAVAFMRQAKDALHKGHESVGLYAPKLEDDLVEHFPRYLAEKYGGKGSGAAADTAWPGMKAREDVFRNVPEGRSALNAMAADPNLVGPQKFGTTAATAHIKQVYGITDDDHAKNLAKWFANLPDDAIGKPVFGSPVRDFMRYMIRGNESLEAAKGIQTFLADNAKAIGSAPDLVPVDELLRKTGFLDSANGKAVNPVAKSRLHKMLGDRGHNLPSADDIANFGVPKELADEVTRVMQGFQTPHALKPVVDAVDSVTSLWKALNTSVAPAFHGRNMLGAAIQNWIIDELSPTLYKQTDALLREGKAIPGAAKWPIVKRLLTERGLAHTDDNALDVLKELAFKHELIGKYQGPGTVTHGTDLLDEFSAAVPGRRPISLGKALGDAIPKSKAQANPLNVRGFGGREASEFSLAKSGEAIGTYTESLSRLAPFFNQLKRGVSDAAAAAKVKAAHVDYSGRNFTDFERSVAGRAMPFYKFCVPEDHEILTQGGWKFWNQVSVGDLTLALDHDSGELHWTPIEAVNVFAHDGELIQYEQSRKHRKINFQFTDEHSWPVVTNTGVVHAVLKSGDKTKYRVGGIRKMVTGRQLKEGHQLVTSGEFRGTESILTERLAAILGWVVTDGYCRWRVSRAKTHRPGIGSCEMVVYQSPGKFLNEIVALLGTTPRKPHPDTGVVCVPVARADIAELSKVFHSKEDLAGIVGRLSRKSAEAMWDAMFKAEGCTQKKTGLQHFAQDPVSNKDVLEAFQMLCLLTGRTANLAVQGCTVKKSKRYHVHKCLSRVQYTGIVWCPTTKYGTWFMRHNGAVVVTGNSRKMAEFLAKNLLEEPGGRLAQTIRGMNRARGNDAGTPDYIAETASIPLGTKADGTRRYLTGFGTMFEDPLSFGGGGVQGALLEGASRLNPLVKAPMEWLAGQSFFQKGPTGGRDLEDLDPTLGRIASNVAGLEDPITFPGSNALEFIAGNSPASRLLTTVRTATDPRKRDFAGVANLLTGVRISDVSPAAQDAITRERVANLMKESGASNFERVYFSDEDKALMSPQERAAAEVMQAFQNKKAKEAKQRKLAKEKARTTARSTT